MRRASLGETGRCGAIPRSRSSSGGIPLGSSCGACFRTGSPGETAPPSPRAPAHYVRHPRPGDNYGFSEGWTQWPEELGEVAQIVADSFYLADNLEQAASLRPVADKVQRRFTDAFSSLPGTLEDPDGLLQEFDALVTALEQLSRETGADHGRPLEKGPYGEIKKAITEHNGTVGEAIRLVARRRGISEASLTMRYYRDRKLDLDPINGFRIRSGEL